MKVVKKILIIILTIVLTIVLSFNLYNFISINILHKDLADINGYAILEVVSGSMEPTIKIGDLIIINTKEKDYKKDDIVTFYDVNGSFVTHRIISINDKVMVTKGDNNNTIDEEISVDNIVGEYVLKINGGGKILSSFKNPFVMVMILLIGVLACFLISTDKDGNPILTDEEKEFMEFKEYKKNKSKKSSKKNTTKKK